MAAFVVCAALAWSFHSDGQFGDARRWSFAEQEVELVSVAHLEDQVTLVFFWARVQGEWACLDYRWATAEMRPRRVGAAWVMFWRDDQDDCYRRIVATHYVESWEIASPLADKRNRPWFAQLLNPGLKKPK